MLCIRIYSQFSVKFQFTTYVCLDHGFLGKLNDRRATFCLCSFVFTVQEKKKDHHINSQERPKVEPQKVVRSVDFRPAYTSSLTYAAVSNERVLMVVWLSTCFLCIKMKYLDRFQG